MGPRLRGVNLAGLRWPCARKQVIVVYLHAGLPKTGSTAIQQACFAGRDKLMERGLNYWSVHANHGSWLLAASENKPAGVQALRSAMNVAPVFVASSEDLPDFGAPRIAALLQITGPAKVIAYVREPRSWYSSLVQQAIRTGGHTLDSALKVLRAGLYRIRLSGLANFPDVELRPYHADVIPDFLEFLGVGDLKLEPPLRNERFAADVIWEVEDMNRRGEKVNYKTIKNRPGERFAIPSDLLEQLLVDCADDIAFASERVGVDLLGLQP